MANHRGRPHILHDIDGRQLTRRQIAEMLDCTPEAIRIWCVRNAIDGQRRTLQDYVDWRRRMDACNGRTCTGNREAVHCVHGQWMTTSQAAEELGVNPRTLDNWRYLHRHDGRKALLEEAWDHYKAVRDGVIPRRKELEYNWHGRRLTTRQLVMASDITAKAIYSYKYRHRCTTQEAIDACDARSTDRATKAILAILTP